MKIKCPHCGYMNYPVKGYMICRYCRHAWMITPKYVFILRELSTGRYMSGDIGNPKWVNTISEASKLKHALNNGYTCEWMVLDDEMKFNADFCIPGRITAQYQTYFYGYE